MKTVYRGKYHAIARCKECGWEEQDYKVAEQKALDHCLKTGHSVDLETGELLTCCPF